MKNSSAWYEWIRSVESFAQFFSRVNFGNWTSRLLNYFEFFNLLPNKCFSSQDIICDHLYKPQSNGSWFLNKRQKVLRTAQIKFSKSFSTLLSSRSWTFQCGLALFLIASLILLYHFFRILTFWIIKHFN